MNPDPQELSHFILIIQKDEQGGTIFFQEFGDRFLAFFRVDTDKSKILGLVLTLQLFQRRSLLPAVGSPRGPEVEEDHFPFIILDLDRIPLEVRQRKIRKGQRLRKGLKGVRPPALSPGRVAPLESRKDKPSQPSNDPDHPALASHSPPHRLTAV